MNGTKLKKLLILNLPYFLFGLYATKLGEAWRLAEGVDASKKILHLLDGFASAFRSPWPSFHASSRPRWIVRERTLSRQKRSIFSISA